MRADERFEPLVTDRLVLRRSRPEDAEAISRYRSVPDVARWQGWDRTDPEAIRAQIEDMATRVPGEPGGWVQLTVEERAGGRILGDVGLAAVAHEPGVVKVGYTIAPEHQGRGYATEAVAALVGYAFEVLGVDVVRVHADADNVSSIRVAEKVGLRFRERFAHRDGDGTWYGVRYELERSERAGGS